MRQADGLPYRTRDLGQPGALALRWGLGLWLIVSAGRSLAVISSGSQLEVFATSLFALAKGIFGVILLSPDLAAWAASPLLRWIDSIYLCGDVEGRPPLDYRLADYYRTTGQVGEAIGYYREIARHYPAEAKALGWLYYLLAFRTKELRAAKRVLRKARRHLRGRDGWEEFKTVVREAARNAR